MLSCADEQKKEAQNSEVAADTTEIIRKFIYGLWSMDSGNALSNVGFYFRPEGVVDFVPADASGTWKFKSPDSLLINYVSFSGEQNFNAKIQFLDESRMILIEKPDTFVYRKVPFGMNSDGMLLHGFAGKLSPGQGKDYTVNLPASKKISFKLNSQNPEIFLQVFEGTKEVTSTPLREWTAIIIRGGSYSVKVFRAADSKPGVPEDFDLKIIGY
jgi:hypothetical protein